MIRLLATLLTLAACGEPSGPVFVLGDVTGDDVVNVTDAAQVQRYVLGLEVSAEIERGIRCVGDVTDDGKITLADAQQIARHSVGLPTTTEGIGEPTRCRKADR